MSQSKEPDRMVKHCLRLHEGDYDKITRLRPGIKANRVIRDLVHEYVKTLEKEQENER